MDLWRILVWRVSRLWWSFWSNGIKNFPTSMIEKSKASMKVGFVCDVVACEARWLRSRVTGFSWRSKSGTSSTLCSVISQGSVFMVDFLTAKVWRCTIPMVVAWRFMPFTSLGGILWCSIKSVTWPVKCVVAPPSTIHLSAYWILSNWIWVGLLNRGILRRREAEERVWVLCEASTTCRDGIGGVVYQIMSRGAMVKHRTS